jgi:prefoldin alpha subunit
MSKDDSELRRLIAENQILERTTEDLQTRIRLVNASVNELQIAHATLEGVKNEKKDSIILVPVGGGSYLKAKIMDPETLIVGIGADVAVEKTISEAQEHLNSNILVLEKARSAIQKQLEETVSRLEMVRRKVQEVSQSMSTGKT